MTLSNALTTFLNNIYDVSGTVETKYIIHLKLGHTDNKEVFKNILAYDYIIILESFTGEYNDLITQDRLQYVIDFLEAYFKVNFNYNLNDLI